MLDTIYGRDEYVDAALDTIIHNAEGVRLAILGRATGKSSVLLAIANDQRIAAVFQGCRYWIQCKQGTLVELFLEIIARSLEVTFLSSDQLKDIPSTPNLSLFPRFLLFGNPDTPMSILQKQTEAVDHCPSPEKHAQALEALTTTSWHT